MRPTVTHTVAVVLQSFQESFPDAEDIDVPEDLKRPFKLKFEAVKGTGGASTLSSKRPQERLSARILFRRKHQRNL